MSFRYDEIKAKLNNNIDEYETASSERKIEILNENKRLCAKLMYIVDKNKKEKVNKGR